MKIVNHGHIFGACLLIAGTSIGAGMLALPLISSTGGFLPSIVVYIIAWIIMTITGLLYLEIALKMPKDSNIVSMSERYLGKIGKFFSWIIYFFLFYSLSVSYISGGAGIIKELFGTHLSLSLCALVFAVIFAFFVYIGALAVDRINIILMFGLVITYLFFVVLGARHVDLVNLNLIDPKFTLLSFPIILISFGYQGIIPSLTYYMNKDHLKIRKAIWIGTTITLVIYLVWELLILGMVPVDGPYGLREALLKNTTAIYPLKHYARIKNIYMIGQFFSFFAITTSFLGVSLGLFDFVSDAFKIKKKKKGKLAIAAITFLPSIIITFINPNLFITALNYAGCLGGIILLILLPVMMVYSKRYFKKERSMYKLKGGKFLLIFLFIFGIFILGVNLVHQILHFVS